MLELLFPIILAGLILYGFTAGLSALIRALYGAAKGIGVPDVPQASENAATAPESPSPGPSAPRHARSFRRLDTPVTFWDVLHDHAAKDAAVNNARNRRNTPHA